MVSEEMKNSAGEARAFDTWVRERVRHFEWFAQTELPSPALGIATLPGAMRWSVLGGGKRVRPLLCYAAGEAVGAGSAVLDRAALALECLHSYSLVHDDMPAMDNDTLRRGRPTTHVKYGEGMALLAGDALQAEAFTQVAKIRDAQIVARLTATLARGAGVLGMCGGQALDLAMVGKRPTEAELLRMESMKTGALILASVLMGAQSGRWPGLTDAARSGFVLYAQSIGLAFQVVDDILDATGDTATLGKTAGKDEKDGKPTWVSFLGLEGARKRAEELRIEAARGIGMVAEDPNADASALSRLSGIADFVVKRSH